MLFKQYTCENADSIYELFYESNGSSEEPNTNDGLVRWKVKDTQGVTGATMLLRDVDMRTTKNENGVPCLKNITFSVNMTGKEVSYSINMDVCKKKYILAHNAQGTQVTDTLSCKF
jgi:hypothetical protein